MENRRTLILFAATIVFLATTVLLFHFGVKWGYLVPGKVVQLGSQKRDEPTLGYRRRLST
jgi:hypothetical protein